MTRRPWLLVLAGVLVLAATSVLVASREGTVAPEPVAEAPRSGLAMLVVNDDVGPLVAVVGRTGFGRSGAVVIPLETNVTIPGQGDATVAEALTLPRRQAATAIANLLGVWIDHEAQIGHVRLAKLVDRVGGIDVGGVERSGAEVDAMLTDTQTDRSAALQVTLDGLFASDVEWNVDDLFEADDPAAVVELLNGAAGASPVLLEKEEVADGIFRSSPAAVSAALVSAFGGPQAEAVPVIVLNGNGIPGVGELVAEKILPGGFRVAVSENASTFDHDETLVVVGSSNDVDLAERVRDLLGVGQVSVSVGSGIAPVTVVVGKDFTG